MDNSNSEKNKLLNKIVDQYLNSNNFNGLSILDLTRKEVELCKELLVEDKIEIYSAAFVQNPHIKSVPLNKEIKTAMYIEEIEKSDSVIFYPTEATMKKIPLDEEKPFTLMLMKGKRQLEIVYFNVEVLESYFQDPRYKVSSYDYRGNIYPVEGFYDELEGEWLRDYGLAYHQEMKNNKRAIGVFICDLAKMSLNAQLRWKINFLTNQEEFHINSGFLKNTIYSEWVDEVSIYDALLEEMIVINKMCGKIGIPVLFKKIFKPHEYEKPEDYRIIILPTLKNYYAFVTSLEKLIVDNINHKTFLIEAELIGPVERNNDDGNPKGSLMLFEEWLLSNSVTANDFIKDIIIPLKEVRKIRQNPAHKIYDNTYDSGVYKLQNELIEKVYGAIRCIRLHFQNHPLCSGIDIPKYLVTGEKIVVY